MPKLEPHDIQLVIGMRGAGKSHHVKKEIVPHYGRIIVWDPHSEYELRHVTLKDFLDDATLLDDQSMRVSVVPPQALLKEQAGQFGTFTRHISTGRAFVLVVDEVACLMYGRDWLDFIATQSRHWSCPVVFIAHRAVQIPVTAREQATRIVSFRQKRTEDIAALEERIGSKANRLPKLRRREFVAWDEEEDFQQPLAVAPEPEPEKKPEPEPGPAKPEPVRQTA